jgi:hypothetical protein
MNIDYGFFQLFSVLKSLRDNRAEAALSEQRAAIGQKVPHINYSLLRNLPVHQHRYQQPRSRRERFGLGIAATCQCPD